MSMITASAKNAHPVRLCCFAMDNLFVFVNRIVFLRSLFQAGPFRNDARASFDSGKSGTERKPFRAGRSFGSVSMRRYPANSKSTDARALLIAVSRSPPSSTSCIAAVMYENVEAYMTLVLNTGAPAAAWATLVQNPAA